MSAKGKCHGAISGPVCGNPPGWSYENRAIITRCYHRDGFYPTNPHLDPDPGHRTSQRAALNEHTSSPEEEKHCFQTAFLHKLILK